MKSMQHVGTRPQLEVESPKSLRPFADNVVLALEDETTESASGIVFPAFSEETLRKMGLPKKQAKQMRIGRVLASGPGYWTEPSWSHPEGVFIANTVQAGDRVLIDALAGERHKRGFRVPRQNDRENMRVCHFEELGEARGEFRIVRESEIHAVLEP